MTGNQGKSKYNCPQRGSVAFIIVIITLAMISAIALEVINTSQVSARIVTNRRDTEKAYELALAATRWSFFRLQLDQQLDQMPAIPNTNYGGKKDDLQEMQWAMPISFPLPAALLAPTAESSEIDKVDREIKEKALEMDGSFLSVIFDESAKINLNDVGTGGPPGARRPSAALEILENLLLSPRFRRFFAQNDYRNLLYEIDDWTDADSEVNHYGGGIEDAEYRSDDPERKMKNAPFYSLAELKLLINMSPELFEELKPFVTVYPFDARIPRFSSQAVVSKGTININTAPLELLAATFSSQVFATQQSRLECAQKAIQFRDVMVFRAVTGPNGLEGFAQNNCGMDPQIPLWTPAVQRILAVSSNVFAIEGTGIVGDVETTVHSVVSRLDPRNPKIFYWKVM